MRQDSTGGTLQEGETIAVVIVAAGRGTRAGGGTPKQYRRLCGKPVLARTLEVFASALPGAILQCVIHPDDRSLYDTTLAEARLSGCKLAEPVSGGNTRQASVLAGLEAIYRINREENIVLIHDSARCLSSTGLIQEIARQAAVSGAAIPGYPIPDALKRVDDGMKISGAVGREGLYAVQTPQGFAFEAILDAHRRAAAAGLTDFADDAAVAEWAGRKVHIVLSSTSNLKLTTAEDFALAEKLIMAVLGDIRVGTGFDVHAFADGDSVWLGGVRIPHSQSLSGHSDADVALHALTDAVLGAIGDGDIGSHFPPSDPQWKGASSDRFLQHAVHLLHNLGGQLAHMDVTIVCEAPRIGPHREAIRSSIARIAGIDPGRVSVKATTTERLGFTGRKEGIAAQAVATVRLPVRSAD
ncbi:MAG: bifunctional 2-C-methyl-D-erythritol 4-phosphate cytidylyltransferase/2-C-methyl-D-erythritol 2,4-cyclodiphosphate synthase [Beijerinckiaceae bacterium]